MPNRRSWRGGKMISVRRLAREDAEAFRDIRRDGLAAHPEAFGADIEDEAAEPIKVWQDRLETSIVFGAYGEKNLVGIYGYYRRSGIKVAHVGVLWGLYVLNHARGRGVGRALVEAVVRHARTEVEQLSASVTVTNEQVRAFYEALGFEAWGIQPRLFKVGGRYYDVVQMALYFHQQGSVQAN